MAGVVKGPVTWSGSWDDEWFREYKITFLVETNNSRDGPEQVLNSFGLPRPGEVYIFDNDADLWAWCKPGRQARPKVTSESQSEPNYHWFVECTFSNKPPSFDKQRCNDLKIEDPILEPPKVSGGTDNDKEEASFDRFGQPIKTSSHEQVRGHQVEFDNNHPTIKIEINVPTFTWVGIAYTMMNRVNDRVLWGLPARCVKLTHLSFEKSYYGLCYVYYKLTMEFTTDIRTFDRDLLDEGSKALNGHWDTITRHWIVENINGEPPDPLNPSHFKRFKDINGDNARVVLDGQGSPFERADPTIDCPDCPAPSGMSKTLAVFGFTGGLTSDTLPSFPLSVQLSWVSTGDDHCVWTGDDGLGILGTCTLHRVGSNWVLSVDEAPISWFLDEGDWTCGMPNVLTYTGGAAPQGWPQSVVVADLNQPGLIHVEKFDEANFYILGIPAIL